MPIQVRPGFTVATGMPLYHSYRVQIPHYERVQPLAHHKATPTGIPTSNAVAMLDAYSSSIGTAEVSP